MVREIGAPLLAGSLVASLLVASGASNVATAKGRHIAMRSHHIHRLHVAHSDYFGGYRPHDGYYTRHGQFVPGAGDRLIYGPGYAYVPGHGILGAACDLPSSTCLNEYRDIQ